MAPIIHRTAARKRKRITNTSIRLLHPTILTTIPRNTTFTISSALRPGSFPRRPHCEKNIHLGFRRAGTQGHDSHPRAFDFLGQSLYERKDEGFGGPHKRALVQTDQ